MHITWHTLIILILIQLDKMLLNVCMVLNSLTFSLVRKMSILTSEFVIFTLNAVVMNGDRHQKLKVT